MPRNKKLWQTDTGSRPSTSDSSVVITLRVMFRRRRISRTATLAEQTLHFLDTHHENSPAAKHSAVLDDDTARSINFTKSRNISPAPTNFLIVGK
jgi:hypothetical protein